MTYSLNKKYTQTHTHTQIAPKENIKKFVIINFKKINVIILFSRHIFKLHKAGKTTKITTYLKQKSLGSQQSSFKNRRRKCCI